MVLGKLLMKLQLSFVRKTVASYSYNCMGMSLKFCLTLGLSIYITSLKAQTSQVTPK